MQIIQADSVFSLLPSPKKRAGENPRAPAETGQDLAIPTYRSCPTPSLYMAIARLPSGQNQASLNHRETGQDLAILTYRRCPTHPCSWRSPDRHSAESGDPALQRETHAAEQAPRTPYFACFTSPNVVNARCAGDTGPRNRRVTNVAGLPPNETSSIW